MTDEDKAVSLFCNFFGADPQTVERIAGGGSNRSYFRLSCAGAEYSSVIAAVGSDIAENRAFILLSEHFRQQNLPVPEVLAVDGAGECYLQTDLGDTSLFSLIKDAAGCGNFTGRVVVLLEKSIRMLAHVQVEGARGLDFSVCYPEAAMTRRMIDWDLSYFKYCFLKPSGVDFSETALQDEFDQLASEIWGEAAEASTFMVRDFQSRNVMVCHDEKPYLIDFQGGRRGPAQYDVASFLWQARAAIPDSLKNKLLLSYAEERKLITPEFDVDRFLQSVPLFALFRLLQTLGAYGFRGWLEGKATFLQSIPAALRSASALLHDDFGNRFPELSRALKEAARLPKVRLLDFETSLPKFDGLTVRVFSFSYKQGLPPDLSDNGGGFAFDCRAVHNPGRYDRYKPLTGLDASVREFLESNGEIFTFLKSCRELVDASVRRYLDRGFTSLSVGFGCTGGRHRSVYSAESMASHIREAFPQVRVELFHAAQGIYKLLEP